MVVGLAEVMAESMVVLFLVASMVVRMAASLAG